MQASKLVWAHKIKVPIEVDQYCINYNGWQIGFSLCNWTDTLSNFNNTKKNHVWLKANFALRNEDQAACSSLSLYLHFLMSGFNYVEKSFFCHGSLPNLYKCFISTPSQTFVVCLLSDGGNGSHSYALYLPPTCMKCIWKQVKKKADGLQVRYCMLQTVVVSFTGVGWCSTKCFLKAHDGYEKNTFLLREYIISVCIDIPQCLNSLSQPDSQLPEWSMKQK